MSNPEQNRQQDPQSFSLTKEIVGQTIKEALGDFKHYFDSSLHSLREENDRWLTSTSQELQQLKKASEISFRFKGNKTQYNFNASLLEKLEKVDVYLKDSKVEAAKPVISEVITEVKKRNKLIRLADKSDAGWKAVDE